MRKYRKGFCRSRHSEIAAYELKEVMNEYEAFRALSPMSQARLYSLLCEARKSYDFRLILHLQPKATAVAYEIEKIRGSLQRIAEFGRVAVVTGGKGSSRKRKAMQFIEREANKWASKQEPDSLPPLFTPVRLGSGAEELVDFGSLSGIWQFFTNAEFLYQFATRAAEELRMTDKDSLGLSPIQWLAGLKLPSIYERIFGNEYTSWVADSGPSDGVAFVVVALEAMKLRTPTGTRYSANTLLVHHRSVLQWFSQLQK